MKPAHRTCGPAASALLAACMLLSACGTQPNAQASAEVRARLNPVDRSARAVTNFTPALRCMDELLHDTGVRDVTLMMEEMRDATQRVPISARDMMTSAISDMTRRSRAVRLSVFGSDQQNLAQLLQQAQRQTAFAVVPRYALRGTVSQLDDSVDKRGGSIGLSLPERLLGFRLGSETRFAVLGFDAALVDTESMTLLAGVSSKNLTVLASRDSSAGDGQAQLRNPGLDVVFSFSASRSEGPSQAARNMVELAAVELIGKLLRLPYWQCLQVADDDPEVRREVEDWFLAMEGSERVRHLQERMRERRYYDGPVDGEAGPAFTAALRTYRRALGLPPEGAVDLEFFHAFVARKVPRGGQGRGAAATAVAARVAAQAPATGASRALQLSSAVERGSLQLNVTSTVAGYVYCYTQDPVTQEIVRIFPNRFATDPRIEAGKRLRVPGAARFVLNPAASYACLHAPTEVYGDLPPPLRWGDFERVRVKSFDEIRQRFSEVGDGAVRLHELPR
jgi:peptidoglycan hydrolase-like protein with peptidoglycan-binding domain